MVPYLDPLPLTINVVTTSCISVCEVIWYTDMWSCDVVHRQDYEVVVHSHDAFAPVAFLKMKEFKLEEKVGYQYDFADSAVYLKFFANTILQVWLRKYIMPHLFEINFLSWPLRKLWVPTNKVKGLTSP